MFSVDEVKQMEESKKLFGDQNRSDVEEWDSSRDGSHPNSPMASTGKRKTSEREPESPGENEPHDPSSWHREKHFRVDPMETDSPASYPKAHGRPEGARGFPPREPQGPFQANEQTKGKISTPILTHEYGQVQGGLEQDAVFDHPPYRPSYYHGHDNSPHSYHGHHSGHYHESPARVHYGSDMGTPPRYAASHGPPPPDSGDGYGRRRWACDFCGLATFASYEEACSHEEHCARRHHPYGPGQHAPPPPHSPYDRPPPAGSGLGALFHASQEVSGPPTPHRKPMWPTHRGPPMPHLPLEHHAHGHHHPAAYPPQQRYPAYPGYEGREVPNHMPRGGHGMFQPNQKRMLLAMQTDGDSLSDRQCYVRSEMVEIFAATDKDVAARHSKGAQKLVEGQVGIRCVFCSHLRPRDRAERAVCYPSSISRIYQTVADMQRFHFEQCREIPLDVRSVYKSLKTTRPRGVGSPQTYWVQSAKLLDLVDTESGIRFAGDSPKESETEKEGLGEQVKVDGAPVEA